MIQSVSSIKTWNRSLEPFQGVLIPRSTALPLGIFTGTHGKLKRVRGVDSLLIGTSRVSPNDPELYRPLRKTLQYLE